MKRLLLLSESKTESLYHLQTAPLKTYVLNYVLTSTIGKFRARRETKNPHPKVRKKSVNTKKNRESYNSRFLCCNEEIDRNSRGGAFGPFRGCRPEKGGAARGLDRATPDLQLSEITRKGDFFVWIESLSGSGFLERFQTKIFLIRGESQDLMLR